MGIQCFSGFGDICYFSFRDRERSGSVVVLDSRPKGRGFEPHRRHCVVSLSKNTYPSLVLVQPRKTRPFITERLLMGRKESNQTNKLFGIWDIFSKYFKGHGILMGYCDPLPGPQ